MSVTAEDAANKSTQTFTTAFVTGLIVAGIYLAIFLVIRTRFRKIYQPKSYLVEPRKRVDPLPHGFLAWIPAIIKADATQIIQKNGLDAYVFVRFLWLMIEMFLPFMLVTWIILLPVDAVGSNLNQGIERFTFGNIQSQPRYAAHLVLTWLLTFYVFYLIKRELAAFIILRQDFLMSKRHSMSPESRTVLVTGLPKEFLSSQALRKFCDVLPGGVKRVWLARHLEGLPDLYKRRNKACGKLESAETALLRKAAKAIAKDTLKDAPNDLAGAEEEQKTLAARVDTIEWAREEIATTTRLLEEARGVLAGPEADNTATESAAFIQFNSQIAAHMFAQCLAHHAPLRMSARYIEVNQEDVIWSNLNVNPYQAKVRYALSWALTVGLIILWSFPVAFVGLLSNVSSLCISTPWLAWLCKLPTPVNGIIQGSLPPIALAVLFLLLPIVLRLFGRLEGIPLHTGIELSLMTRYFLFLVIHGFLIVTLSSGLVAALPEISRNPASTVTLLATKLPAASTFFLTYFVTTSLAGAAGSLLQVVTLIIYYVKLFILASTPRSVHNIKFQMSTVSWGTLFPNMTLLTVIGLTYSIIAPLVCGFAFMAFALFWFVYKYLFIWVIDTPAAFETGGLFYPKAINHIFVGLYIEEICMTGLFFIARIDGKQSAIPQGALMIVLIVFTAFFHITMSAGYSPLIAYLPLSAAPRMQEIDDSINNRNASSQLAREKGEKTENLSQPVPGEERAPDSGASENTVFPPPGNSEIGHGLMQEEREKKEETDTLLSEPIELDKNAFDHPATYLDQPTIWIPVDEAGLYRHEVEAIRAAGIEVSSEGARMNAKGRVDIDRAPPGEEWDPSQDI